MGSLKSQQYPFKLFDKWFAYAKVQFEKHSLPNFNAVALSTVNSSNQPSSRMVLIKSVEADGLIFYTNLNSKKSQEIQQNNQVCLLFYWGIIGRQVRIEGTLKQVSDQEADEYFNSRPYLSKIGAIASKQSCELESRFELEKRVIKFSNMYKNDVTRPSFWSGYKIYPKYFEFWKEGAFRNHKRVSYSITEQGVEEVFLYP